MKMEIPKRCPCCNVRWESSGEKILFRFGDTTFWCKRCKNYSRIKPGASRVWYCSVSMDIIQKMMKEDGHA